MAQRRAAVSAADQLKSSFGRFPLLEFRDIFSRQDKLLEAQLRVLEDQRNLLRAQARMIGAVLPPIEVRPIVEVTLPPTGPLAPGFIPEVPSQLPAAPGIIKHENYFYDERGISPSNPSPREIEVISLLRRPSRSGFIISDDQIITLALNGTDTLVTLNPTEKFTLTNTDPFEISDIIIRSAAVTAKIRIFLI